MNITINAKLKEYLLENVEEIRSIANDLNSWDGSLENLQVMENDEEFFNTYFDGKPAEAVRAAFYGDYRYMDEYVRFNGYANLESLTDYQLEEELKSNVDEVIDLMLENLQHIDVSDEIQEILDEEEENEEE